MPIPFERQQEISTAKHKEHNRWEIVFFTFSTLYSRRKYRTMGNKFFRIDDHTALENLLTDSKQKPVIVFKHSTACPISARAYREMEKINDQVNILVVQSAREISSELSNLTGVRHETPQVIVLRDGKAVWNASHFDVTAGDVTKALQSHS